MFCTHQQSHHIIFDDAWLARQVISQQCGCYCVIHAVFQHGNEGLQSQHSSSKEFWEMEAPQ
jgi:hypothetical protein